MVEHLIPDDWTGYREVDILAMDAGSKSKSFGDKRSKVGHLGWSYHFINELGGPNIGPQHEDLLSGQCYDYWLIWDLVIPEAGKIFSGKSKKPQEMSLEEWNTMPPEQKENMKWESLNITAEQKQTQMNSNNGKRFYELHNYSIN